MRCLGIVGQIVDLEEAEAGEADTTEEPTGEEPTKAGEVDTTEEPTVDTKTAPTAPPIMSAQPKLARQNASGNTRRPRTTRANHSPMPEKNIEIIGEVQEYIADALQRGVSRAAKFFIQVDEGGNFEHCTVHFVDDDGRGGPPFMVATGRADDDAAEPDITTTTKVDRKVFNKALKKARHDLRKVKLTNT